MEKMTWTAEGEKMTWTNEDERGGKMKIDREKVKELDQEIKKRVKEMFGEDADYLFAMTLPNLPSMSVAQATTLTPRQVLLLCNYIATDILHESAVEPFLQH